MILKRSELISLRPNHLRIHLVPRHREKSLVWKLAALRSWDNPVRLPSEGLNEKPKQPHPWNLHVCIQVLFLLFLIAYPFVLATVKTEEPMPQTHANYIEPIYFKGTSRRIYGELYKVIDSSDVILHVLDARDPFGTMCESVLDFIKREKAHKQVVLIINKCDLVPNWVTVSTWMAKQQTVFLVS